MAHVQPLYSTDVDLWLLENFPTAKGAKDAYDTFSSDLYGSEVDDEDEDGNNDASDEEDRKAVELALTWHATSNPPPLLERYLGLGLRSSESSATSETQPATPIIPTQGTGSTSNTLGIPPYTATLLERMSSGNPTKPEWRSSSRTDQREEGSASSTADVPPSTATLLERMSFGNPSKLEWRSSSLIDQREEFLRRTARGHTPSVLQELPTNRPSARNPKDEKMYDTSRGGSRGPPPWTASSYRRSDDSVRDHGRGGDLRYDQPRRGGGPERSDLTALHMPPRRLHAAARKDTPQPPRRLTNATAPSASLQPAQPSPVPADQDEQSMSTSQEAQLALLQSPATPESYLRLATDPTSRGLMARIYKLVAIAYMYRAGSVRMQHDINALCVAYQAPGTDPASQPEVAFKPPPEWHDAMLDAFLPKMLADFAEEDTKDVANELLETIPEIEQAIEDGLQPPPLRKYLVVALILYIEHLIEFGAETIEQMKDWPEPLPRT